MKKLTTHSFFFMLIFFLNSTLAFSQANTGLSNLIVTSINQSLVPNTNNGLNIGSKGKSWKNMFADGTYFLDDNAFVDNPGTRNTFLGATRIDNIYGTDNTFVGDLAGQKNEDGSYNVFIGGSAGGTSQGSRNTFTGYQAGGYYESSGGGDDNSIYGFESGGGPSEWTSGNCYFGAYTAHSTYSGSNNCYFGFKSGYTNTSATDNSFFGANSGYNTTDMITGGGSANSFFGGNAGYDNFTGYYNTFIGHKAGQGNTNGDNNSTLGTLTKFSSSDLFNATAIGALAEAGSSNSIVLGAISGVNGSTTDTKVGIGTTIPGARLDVENYSNDSYGIYHYFRPGSTNSHYGIYNFISFLNNPTGLLTGIYNSVSVSSSNNSSVYGTYSIVSGGSGSGSHYGVYASASGGLSNYAFYSAGDSYATGMWLGSDEKLKKNIVDVDDALSKIMKLQARRYYFRTDEFDFMNLPKGKQYGFIAQELEKVFPEMVRDIEQPKNITNDEKTGKPADSQEEMFKFKGVNYQMMIPVLTEAIQEQQQQMEAKEERIGSLEQEVSDLKNSMSDLMKLLNDNGINTSSVKSNTSVKEPVQFRLEQNVPNPVTGQTVIQFIMPQSVASAEIKLTDVAGNPVKTIQLQNYGEGQVTLDTASLPAGNYYYSLWADGKLVATKQLSVVH